MTNTKELHQLHKKLEAAYRSYREGAISEKEYCSRAKPIDEAIGRLEMATLLDTLVLKGSSLSPSHRPEN